MYKFYIKVVGTAQFTVDIFCEPVWNSIEKEFIWIVGI